MNEHSRSELPATVAFSRNDENGVNKTVCVTKGVCGWAREQWRVAVDASRAEDKQRSWQFSSRRWLHRLYASRSKTKLTASWQAEAQASPSAGLSEMHQISSHCCDQYNFIMAAQRTSTSAVSAAAHIGLVSYWHGCYLSKFTNEVIFSSVSPKLPSWPAASLLRTEKISWLLRTSWFHYQTHCLI